MLKRFLILLETSQKLHQQPLDPNHFKNVATVIQDKLMHTPTHTINTWQAKDNAW